MVARNHLLIIRCDLVWIAVILDEIKLDRTAQQATATIHCILPELIAALEGCAVFGKIP